MRIRGLTYRTDRLSEDWLLVAPRLAVAPVRRQLRVRRLVVAQL